MGFNRRPYISSGNQWLFHRPGFHRECLRTEGIDYTGVIKLPILWGSNNANVRWFCKISPYNSAFYSDQVLRCFCWQRKTVGDSLEMAFLAMDPVIGCINSFGRIPYIINKQGIWRLIFFSHLAWMREFDFPFRLWNIQSVYTSFANIYNSFGTRDQQMLCLSHPNPAQFTGLPAKDHDAFLCVPPTSDPRGIFRRMRQEGSGGAGHEPHQLGCPLVEPRFELNRYRKK